MEWQKGRIFWRDLCIAWNEMILLPFLQQVIACFVCALLVLCDPECFSSQHLALSLLWVFWFVLSCSFLLFVHEVQARAACCPFDDISAQLMLARLWNRSSCNMGPPQQVSHPASVPSPCTHPEEPVCLQCHDCNSSQPEVICNLPPVTLSHRREEGLDSLSYGKYSGSRLPLAFPHLDTSSAKHFNRVRWAAVYSPLPPTPTWQKTSLWHWRFFPEEVSTVWSGVGCFDITYLWQILKILVKNHDSFFANSVTSVVRKYARMMERGFFFPTLPNEMQHFRERGNLPIAFISN